MKKIISALTVSVIGLTVQAQTESLEDLKGTATENLKKKNVVGKIIDDLKENTRTVHQINKENLVAVKDAYWKANPDMLKMKEAKGFKNKVKVVANSMKNACKETSEKEKERREDIQSHESYKNLLKEQREKRETIINREC